MPQMRWIWRPLGTLGPKGRPAHKQTSDYAVVYALVQLIALRGDVLGW